MNNKWIRKGDEVVVLSGNERGKKGKVVKREDDCVVVQGLNVRKKHVRKTQNAPTQQIASIETPIHISNVALASEEGKPLHLKVKLSKDGNKELFYQKDGKEVIFRTIKKAGV